MTRLVLIAFFLLAGVTAEANDNQVTEAPRWREFIQHVQRSYFRSVETEPLSAACRNALASPRRAPDVDPFDLCIETALEMLDRESSYMPAKEFAAEREQRKNPFVGVGLELSATKPPGGGVTIVSAIAGGPAHRGGVRAGDRILQIDGVNLVELDFDATMRALRGPIGSRMNLTLERTGVQTPVNVVLVRERIEISRVRSQQLREDTAWLRIGFFTGDIRQQMEERVASLSGRAGVGPALIVDLRNNPGGELDSLQSVASLFLEPNTLLLRLNQRNETKQIHSTDRASQQWLRTVPIVVLVNRGTGGGAEALAQILRERRGALLVGERTFGAGLITSKFELDGTSAVRLATAQMISGLGTTWMPWGLSVDVPANDSGLEFGAPGDEAIEVGMQVLLQQRKPSSR